MSKKGKRLREFEKNNREFNISEAQRQRQESHRATRERKKLKGVSGGKPDVQGKTDKRGKKKNKIANAKRLIAGVIILIFITSIVVSAVKILKLKSERDKLLETNNRLTELKEDLTAEMDQIDSAEYIEQQARKELKMIKSGEILFLVSDEQGEGNDEAK